MSTPLTLPRMKRIGLTGGIGSGKSAVVKLFQEQGIPTVDADAVARKLREPGQPAHTEIIKRFGTDDRSELRKILSQDPQAKKDLEAILHPWIKRMSELEFDQIEKNSQAPFLLYEAALIIESGRTDDFDALIVVTAPEKVRIARIEARDQVTPEAAMAMIFAQMKDSERLEFADYHLENAGSLEDLRSQVIKLLGQLR